MHLTMRPHKWLLSLAFALACCTLAGCHSQHRPITREELVGNYTYVSKDPEDVPTNRNLNRLALQADGKYDLVRGGTTRAVSEKKGDWRIIPGDPPNVFLNRTLYPIEMKRNEVRLMVDYDVGIWWVKVN